MKRYAAEIHYGDCVEVYLCSEADDVIRGLRAQVLRLKSNRWSHYSRTVVGALRRAELLNHYARLIESNKAGWWNA